MSAHLRVEQVADLTEGLLDEAEAASARAHLDRCDRCQQVRRELAQLQAVLAAEGADSPAMPIEVAERIDAALARQTRARGRWPRALVAAASVVVVGAAIGYGVERLPDAGSSDDTSTAAGLAADQVPTDLSGDDAKTPTPEVAAGSGKDPGAEQRLLSLDRERFSTQVRRQLSALGFTTESKVRGLLDACVVDALGPRTATVSALYDAELDGRPVTLVVQPQDIERRKVFAVKCAGEPRVLAQTSLP